MKITINLIFIFILHGGNLGHSLMNINRPTTDAGRNKLEEQFKTFLEGRPAPGGFLSKFIPVRKTPQFICSLNVAAKKYACETILNSPAMEKLETDDEYLMSKTCNNHKIRFLQITYSNDPKKKSLYVDAFQCPPTRLVSCPHFLMDGEDGTTTTSLYVLHRKGKGGLFVIAHVTDVDKKEFNGYRGSG